MVEIISIEPQKARAKTIRRILGAVLRQAFTRYGTSIAGFAIVVWDDRGDCNSSFYSETGPIDENLVPAFVHDALNRHVAVLLAQRTMPQQVPSN